MISITVVSREAIRIVTNTGAREVPGARMGPLAIIETNDRTLDDEPFYGITHVATGFSCGNALRFLTEKDGLACIRALLATPVNWNDPHFSKRTKGFKDAFYAIAYLCGGVAIEEADDV